MSKSCLRPKEKKVVDQSPWLDETFHPDVVAIDKRRLPRTLVASIATILLSLIFGVLWLVFAELERVVDSDAVLVSKKSELSVQSFTQAVLRNTRFRVGEVVRAGDLLVEFEAVVNQSKRDALKASIEGLLAEQKRLVREGDVLAHKSDYVAFITSNVQEQLQEAILFQRTMEIQTRRQATEIIEGFVKQTLLLNEKRKDFIHRQIQAAEHALSVKVGLKRKDLATAESIRSLEDQVIGLRAELLRVENEGALLQQQQRNAEGELANFVNVRMVDVRVRLAEIEKDLGLKKQELATIDFYSSRDKVYAEFDGVVTFVSEKARGTSVSPSDTIMIVAQVTNERDLEIETTIASKDSGWVAEGQRVRFKLDSLSYTKHGAIEGIVRSVGTESALSAKGALALKAHVAIEKVNLKQLPNGFKFLPGMKGRAEVIVGKRAAYEYLLGPLLDGSKRTLSEPN